jgi:hypothetical protein
LKRILDQLKSRFLVHGDNNFNDVKAKKDVGIVQQTQPGETAARDTPSFLSIHCYDRSAEIFACSCFYFDENEGVVIARDNVNLAATVAAEITIQNFVALLAQESPRKFLAQRAAPDVFRPG